jgi:hypothetical protein
VTWQPKIEGKKRGRTPGVPPLSHSSGEYWKWGPASAIHTSREYQPPIGPKETKALSPKSTKIKTASFGAQLARLKTVLGWAIVHGRFLGASIPYLEFENVSHTGKSGLKNGRN